MPTALGAGDAAVIGYNTGQTDGAGSTADSIQIVLLRPIDSGTVLYITDRSWNGSAFTGAGGDGTITYTAGGALAAGTVINLTIGGGFDLDQNGDAVYVYQGTDANTPTQFLFALELGDGNNVFNSSLVNTGLTAGLNAVGVGLDSATYNGPTTEAGARLINGQSLIQSISDGTNWPGDDADVGGGPKALDQPNHSGPYGLSPDFQIITGTSGGGGGIVSVGGDASVSGGNAGFNLNQIYTNLLNGGVNVFWGIKDVVFDTVHGKFFIADSDGIGGHNRVLQGNISDFLGNPTSVPALTTLYSNATASIQSRIDRLDIDPNNGIVYFANGQTFAKLSYNSANQTPVTLANFGTGSGNPNGSTNNFIDDFVINYATGTVYLSSHRVLAAADGDQVSRNYIYKITGLDSSDGAGAFTFANSGITVLPFSPDDDDSINGITWAAGEGFPQEVGSVEGLALSADGNTLYISAARTLYDNNGDGGTGSNGGTAPILTPGGIYSYALNSNPNGTFNAVYVPTDDGNDGSFAINTAFGPQGLLDELEIDPVTGDLFFIDWTGDQNGASNQIGDEGIWRVDTDGTPDASFFQGISNINGNPPVSIFLNRAPTVSTHSEGVGLTVTEPNGAGSGATNLVQPFTALDVTDADTFDQNDQLAGAIVRISSGFQSGAGHQDTLTINGNTTGTVNGISYSYSNSTGVMTLTGANTFNNYEAAIALVRFNTSGDNPTAYGTATSRTIAWSVSDGMLHSDEVTASVTVTGVNDAPVNSVAATQFINEDASRTFSTGNGNALSVGDVDADPASQALQVTLSVTHGTLTLASLTGLSFSAGDGTGDTTMTFTGTANAINAALGTGLTFAPVLDYNGDATLTIVTSDQGFNGTGGALSDTDNVTITLAAVADIANDIVALNEDVGASNLNLLANDSFENSGRAITSVGSASHGTVTINDNGTAGDATDDFVVYTADANFNGTDSFTYTVTSGGVTETATVTVNVADVNDAPTVGGDGTESAATIDEDSPSALGQTVSTLFAGQFADTIDNQSAFGGSAGDSFAGIVVTGNGSSGATGQWQYFNGAVWTDIGARAEGNGLVLSGATAIRFNPAANFNGTAPTLTAHLYETGGALVSGSTIDLVGSPPGGTTVISTGTVMLSQSVTAVNDLPVFAGLDNAASFTEDGPAAVLDGNATVSDVDLAAANDFSGASLTLARSGGANAEDLFGASGTLAFTGAGSGDVTIGATTVGTYVQSGGTLTISYNANATQALVNTTLQQLTYTNTSDTPPGSATIAYTFDDGNSGAQGTGGAGVANGTITVSITAHDDAAVAVDDPVNVTPENATVIVNVLGNDSDPDGPAPAVAMLDGQAVAPGDTVTLASGAVVTLNLDGTLTYDPSGKFDALPDSASGASNIIQDDVFTYTLVGGASATVTVSVTGVDTDDTLLGSDFNDILDGGIGVNTMSYANASAGVTVSLAIPGSQDTIGAGVDTLLNIQNLTGSAFADTLTGDAGANVLDGGLGADRMKGGAGDDIYYVDNVGDRAVELAGQGNDEVRASVSYSLAGQQVERLTLTGTANIDGTGNSLDNVLTGNAGANRLVGGGGNDIYYVGAGDVAIEVAGQGTDTVIAAIGWSLAGQQIENLTLIGNAAINGKGNGLDNVLIGNSAANLLSGGAGNDTYYVGVGDLAREKDGEGIDTVMSDVSYNLMGQFVENLTLLGTADIDGTGNGLDNVITGNAGANTLTGGGGNDTFVVDNIGDKVFEADGEGTDTVQSSVSFNMAGQFIENLVLTGAAIAGGGNQLDNHMTGNGGANVLFGAEGSDTLDGGAGADQLIGGLGNDVFVVDDAGDKAYEFDGEGTDTVQSSVSYTLIGQAIENLTLTGAAAIDGFGNSLDNVLTGNDANNRLNGRDGADTLSGGAGMDELHGGDGNDLLTGGADADSFWFETVLNAATNIDTITDFVAGVDTIVLDHSVFGLPAGSLNAARLVIGTAAQDANDRIIYDDATGALYFDADGSGAGAAVHFATIGTGLALTASDFSIF